MRFTIATVFTLALGAVAFPSPQAPTYPAPGDVTVGMAGDTCGKDMELSCCNKVEQNGDKVTSSDGILAGLLGGDGGVLGKGELFSGCSKLTVTALIGVDDLLNSQCKQNAACCQHSGTTQEGLVNVGLPCVALSSLI
ncbi:hypothetical protein GGR55DRAFT_632019 [Xylaria sp. FL0064]|nr:hypothetical protein GGR55DRAFT_632019 [Xylaria sp. FL0064]